MRTARQGSLDGLCGVYALINAVDLVIRFERHSTLPKELFIQLTHGLGAASILSSTTDGLDVLELERAASLAFRWLSDVHGHQLVVERPFEAQPPRDMPGYLKALRREVSAPETAVIVRFRTPKIDHWSVVANVVHFTLQLRDSDGLRQLDASDFELDEGPTHFWPADTLIIRHQPFRWLRRVGARELEQVDPPANVNTLAIRAAMDEMDTIGRAKFLKKYGASADRKTLIARGDRLYDATALEAAAVRRNSLKAGMTD